MRKFRVWMPLEMEERFLNKNALAGYQLASITPFRLMPPLEMRIYRFTKMKDEKRYVYRIDSRRFETELDYKDYLQLMEDDGWQFFRKNFAFDNLYSNYYFYKNAADCKDVLFSDEKSKLAARNQTYTQILLYIFALLFFAYLLPFGKNHTNSSDFLSYVLQNWWVVILVTIIVILLGLKLQIHFKMKNSV